MNEYKWWGKEGEPPPNFQTKKQLAQLGLAPLKPSGVIKCRDCELFLYDINNSEACRPKRKCSPQQLETLAANRLQAKIKRDYQEWYKEIGFIEKDRVAAVLWAREQLNQNDWVILDTETTGLYYPEIVEIAVVNCTGEALLNTLVKPTITIPAEVT